MITLQDAIDDLYRIAVVERKSTSSIRLNLLADFCVQELQNRGLSNVRTEVSVPGAGREKKWDVAWEKDGKYRLGISLKSLLRNLRGTVPNRIDDLIGEVANAQLYSPEIVIGYIVIFNIEDDVISPKHRQTWCDLFSERLHSLSGRTAPSWTVGVVEDFRLITVNFATGSSIDSTSGDIDQFFDVLVQEIVRRNPTAISSI